MGALLSAGFLTRFRPPASPLSCLEPLPWCICHTNWFGQEQGESYEYHVLII